MDKTSHLTSLLLIHRKKRVNRCIIAVPLAAAQAATTVVEVEVDTPTYLEVPDFQRVAILGDIAAGVSFVFLSCH